MSLETVLNTRHYTTKGEDPYEEFQWGTRDSVLVNGQTGETVFEQRNVEFPTFWSQNAVNIVTQRYFRGTLGTEDREHSLKQLVDRVVDRIVSEGHSREYFGATAAQTLSDELKYVLVAQMASFNSPVWFNIGTNGTQQASACLPYDTLIDTVDGLIPIGSLVEDNMVGKYVRSFEGDAEILAVKDNGVKEVFRVTTKSGNYVDVTADHTVWVNGAWGQVEDLVPGDQMFLVRTGEHRGKDWSFALSDEEAEAALAGWLQTDGYVGKSPTAASFTVEALSVKAEERSWIELLLSRVWPDHKCSVSYSDTQDESLEFTRMRLYGDHLIPFAEKWGLLKRKDEKIVPEYLYTAPLREVQSYLRSVFQADGSCSVRESSGVVALGSVSQQFLKGVQRLLQRLGIFAKISGASTYTREGRLPNFSLSIRPASERSRFQNAVGFISQEKSEKLRLTLEKPGVLDKPFKTAEVATIESIGEMDVYDIQTSTGEFVADGLRVHNCFILDVEDDMESILNWYFEEGRIFKGGSGAGVNLSKIRSSKEKLSSGGDASGPVSFMRGADASAGTIKSGGKTRRAAKMVILNDDHPDIRDFIWCKAEEEKKVRALAEAGFDMSLSGDGMRSIQYQNANNSVRITDDFMEAALTGNEWYLKDRHGETVETVDAEGLLGEIAQAAWESADPGVQFDSTINDWNTCPEDGRIEGSNPCSEYFHLNDTACNLASINLMKFRDGDGSFMIEQFEHVVSLMFVAQDILVGFSDYPTESIGRNARKYRELGLGYANLGALIMTSGVAYDSWEGRGLAASITSLLTARAYETSAMIAEAVAPYLGYEKNKTATLRVLGKHRDSSSRIDTPQKYVYIKEQADKRWDNVIGTDDNPGLAERYGVRNSQATVLAPTGTIGLMMDCDTTGVEPDLGLVKTKMLVGGGSMRFVNQSVRKALMALGYSDNDIVSILDFIEANDTIVGSKLKADHLPVFACSMGDNTIAPEGHVAILGAIQPFLSGGISKTINLPSTATVEDVRDVIVSAWKQDVKAVAVYRDGSKNAQPLSVNKKETVKEPETVFVERTRATREPLPRVRDSRTYRFEVAGAKGFLTVGQYDDGRPGEIFVSMSKQGSTLAGIMNALAVSVSHGLQHGVPFETYVKSFINMRFEPAGITDDPDFRIASSILDYAFRRVAADYMDVEYRAEIGVLTTKERTSLNEDDHHSVVEQTEDAGPSAGIVFDDIGVDSAHDAPYCLNCGVQMRPSGVCHVCPSCGETSGCS